jgi:hypothetical protein
LTYSRKEVIFWKVLRVVVRNKSRIQQVGTGGFQGVDNGMMVGEGTEIGRGLAIVLDDLNCRGMEVLLVQLSAVMVDRIRDDCDRCVNWCRLDRLRNCRLSSGNGFGGHFEEKGSLGWFVVLL